MWWYRMNIKRFNKFLYFLDSILTFANKSFFDSSNNNALPLPPNNHEALHSWTPNHHAYMYPYLQVFSYVWTLILYINVYITASYYWILIFILCIAVTICVQSEKYIPRLSTSFILRVAPLESLKCKESRGKNRTSSQLVWMHAFHSVQKKWKGIRGKEVK